MISGYFSLGNFLYTGGNIPDDVERRIKDYFAYGLSKPVFFTIEVPELGKSPCVASFLNGFLTNGVLSSVVLNVVTYTLRLDFTKHNYTIVAN